MLRKFAVSLAVLMLPLAASAGDATWISDWDEGFRVARTQNKLVFVDFYADWCGPCRMMDEKVFPQPEVQQRLKDYVLVRIDVDTAKNSLKKKAPVLPTYRIYDHNQRECFSFNSAMKAPDFVLRLDVIKEAAPFMVRAAALFDANREADALIQVAKGYTVARQSQKARETWDEAGKVALKGGDKATAQVAAISGAFTWTIDGNPKKSITLLKKIVDAPVNDETAALGWLTLGQAHLEKKDPAAAREALEKSKTLVPAGHVIAQQVDAVLSRIR